MENVLYKKTLRPYAERGGQIDVLVTEENNGYFCWLWFESIPVRILSYHQNRDEAIEQGVDFGRLSLDEIGDHINI